MVRPIKNEDTGIKILYQSINPSVDIVAIHGLGAHPDHTWAENINRDSNKAPQYVNWLDAPNMLQENVPKARIMRFGYRSQWFGGKEIETGAVSVIDIAERLLKELESNRKGSNQPLIFIAHSFGGLVLMNAIRLSFDSPEKWLNPFASTIGLIFLGTPFRGRYGMSYTNMVKAAILTTSEDQVWPESLEFALPGNEFLIQTVRQFLDARKRDYPIPIYCFYETLPSDVGQVVKGPSENKYVVPRESACLDESEGIFRHPLERNHYNLNKFGSSSEEAYRAVRDAIVMMATRSSTIIKHRSKYPRKVVHQGGLGSGIKAVSYSSSSEHNVISSTCKTAFGKMERATYLLLPNSVTVDHARLGRVITDIYAPGHNFSPRWPPVGPNLLDFISKPRIQRHARGIFRNERYAPIWGELSDLLHIDFSRDGADDVQWSTGTLITRTFLDHETYLRQLVKKNREVREFIHEAWSPEDKKNRREVFLIVGIKEWTEAEFDIVERNQSRFSDNGAAIIRETVQSFAPKTDVSLEDTIKISKQAAVSGEDEGDAVFAVQYRRVKQSPMNKLVLQEAKRLGQSTFSGNETECGKDQALQAIAADKYLNFELDDPLDETFLERGDLVFNRIELGDDDILVEKLDDGSDDL